MKHACETERVKVGFDDMKVRARPSARKLAAETVTLRRA